MAENQTTLEVFLEAAFSDFGDQDVNRFRGYQDSGDYEAFGTGEIEHTKKFKFQNTQKMEWLVEMADEISRIIEEDKAPVKMEKSQPYKDENDRWVVTVSLTYSIYVVAYIRKLIDKAVVNLVHKWEGKQ